MKFAGFSNGTITKTLYMSKEQGKFDFSYHDQFKRCVCKLLLILISPPYLFLSFLYPSSVQSSFLHNSLCLQLFRIYIFLSFLSVSNLLFVHDRWNVLLWLYMRPFTSSCL